MLFIDGEVVFGNVFDIGDVCMLFRLFEGFGKMV